MNINDIFNRPPAISEDTLHYTLFPPDTLTDKVSVTTLATVMQAYVEYVLPNFLWHRDAFQLKVVPNEDGGEGFVLEGRMRAGDCVDDEWCAVWLLWQISGKWDVAISVSDSDGEFLLIEAAEHLPSWVTPTNAENRVWIYQSHLHLIPPSHVSSSATKPRRRKYSSTKDSDDEGEPVDRDDEDYINVSDALKVLRDSIENTVAPKVVEEAVWNRIHGYPAAANQHVHHTKTYLPSDVAKALSQNPTLVQKAVETFYTRDAIQLRAAHRMSRFPPEPSVLTTTKMTRTAYAQLMGQKFYPPKIYGRWTEREDTPGWRWRDIGMKIACGFEMLYQESKNKAMTTNDLSADASKSSAEARKDALRRNQDYVAYIGNLKDTGYFRDELEGSVFWNQLEDKAALAFIEARKDDDATRTSFAAEVKTALAQVTGDDFVNSREEDSEDWLNVNEADFDAMLEKTAGQAVPSSSAAESAAMDIDSKQDTDEDRMAHEQAEKLQKMAKKVEEFLERKGDIEGARFQDEFSDEESEDDDSEDANEDDMSDSDEDETGSSSRPQMTELDRAAHQEAMDKLVPGIDPSEYGKMPPSYHGNSQRVKRPAVETDAVEISTPGVTATKSEPQNRTIRPPILPRDKYEGVDSDSETDEDDVDSEDEEDQPQVVGDVEIDMEAEEEEFIEFARQALGLTDDQWNDIVNDRKGRGVFVPASIVVENKDATNKQPENPSVSTPESSQRLRTPAAGPRPNVNPNLDSFEAVMQAMDVQLARSKSTKRAPTSKSTDKGKGKAKATEPPDEGDIEDAMDAELRATLEGDEVDDDSEEKLDYNLIKNFLESFKSQGGLSGPVGNLIGRLQPDWKLPRDQS